jgi:hypothetical protein
MTTVFVLLHTVRYEGSALRGVYTTEEEARAAWKAWNHGRDPFAAVATDIECDIREVEVGAPADYHW